MNKKARQYIGIMAALAVYYIIHEGAHLICALLMGVFKQINLMGLGIQIDVNNTVMTDIQMGFFCFVGARRKILCKRFSTKSRISRFQCA